MYYEEAIINHILHVRLSPTAQFRPLTPVELTQKLIYERNKKPTPPQD